MQRIPESLKVCRSACIVHALVIPCSPKYNNLQQWGVTHSKFYDIKPNFSPDWGWKGRFPMEKSWLGCPAPSWRDDQGWGCMSPIGRELSHTDTQAQCNLIVKPNQKWQICHTPISHWVRFLGYVGFEFTLQITFGAKTVQWPRYTQMWLHKFWAHEHHK